MLRELRHDRVSHVCLEDVIYVSYSIENKKPHCIKYYDEDGKTEPCLTLRIYAGKYVGHNFYSLAKSHSENL